jgi:hypothetical protein
MGFTPQSTILKLTFEEGTPLHGLTVRMTSCTIGQWNDMLIWSGEQTRVASEVATANERVAQLFLDHLVSWDLEIPAGTPVPTTMDGWKSLDQNFADLLITAWQVAMVSIPKSLPRELNSGETSREQSLDLENLSASLPSWTPPN